MVSYLEEEGCSTRLEVITILLLKGGKGVLEELLVSEYSFFRPQDFVLG